MKFIYKNHNIIAKIIIIEKDKDLSRAYELLLNSHPNYHVVETYSSYNKAIKNDNPNVVLLGFEGSLDNCISNISKILKARARTDIVVLISHNDTEFAIKILKAGASGIMVKSGNYYELFNAIDEVLNGGAPLAPSVSRALVRSLHKKSHYSSLLTNREFQVLEMLAMGMTYSWMAEVLFLSKETIKSHVSRIYSKLDVSGKTEALIKARANNLLKNYG